jgi:ABC-type transport system substrate-binding protein
MIVEAGPVPSAPSPLSAESPAEWRFVEMVYAPLFSKNGNGGFAPYLAESATSLNEGKSLQVAIREDAVWQNGKSVTPLDVVYTYTLAKEGKWNNAWRDQLRAIESVRRSDDGFEVVFDFKHAVKNPERLLTVPLLPNGLHGPGDEPDRQRPLPLAAIGAGPYMPAGPNEMTHLVLHKDAVRKPRISEIRIMTAGNRALALDIVRLMPNAVTFDADPTDAALLNQEFGVRMLRMPQERLLALVFSAKGSLLANKRFRQAVIAGMDRSELFVPGEPGRPSAAPVIPGDVNYPAHLNGVKRDSIEARRILWWSDWERDSDQIYFLTEGALSDKEPAAIKLLVDADDSVSLRRAILFKQRMLESAIQVNLDTRPRFEFMGRIRARAFPSALVSIDLPLDGNLSPLFHSKGGRNLMGFSNPKVDQLLEAGDMAGAIKAIVQLEPMIFIGIQRTVGAAGAKVKGSFLTGRGGLGRIEKWRVQ